jgi:hypothetical protein
MSELGSNKGQDEDKNTLAFNSEQLAEKQKADHFANIKDVEARQKEAERKAKAAEREAETAHKDAVKQAAKKADKEARGAKGGIWNFLFGGWHKIATIVLLIALIALLAGVIICICCKNNNNAATPKALAEEYYTKQRESVDVADDLDGYVAARDAFEKRYNETSGEHEKFYEGYYYSLFVYFEGINFYDALGVFESVKIPDDYTEEEACDLKDAARYFYEDNDFSGNEKLETIIKDCKLDEKEQ